MTFSPNLKRLRRQAALLTLACGAQFAHADDGDAINPDRPNVANSSQVVGHGRVQLEIGVDWDRQRNDDLHVRTLSTPALLRIGLGDTTELRVETDGRSIEHDRDPATRARTTTAGWNATSIGVKWHFADGEGAHPAMGLIGTMALPSGSSGLRVKGVLPQLVLAAEWELPKGWSLAVTPGAGADVDDDGARYHYGILAASLGKKFTERLQGFLEVAAPQIASASHGGDRMQADAGVSWRLNRNCQVDAMVVRGLNGNTPDLGLAFGLSVRR
ncbi:transporter [Massilia oculi]|uniref:transporter n=1 Tax=Massilia oculi TaxID=945844 RepID=UPI001AAF7EA2|nr:transporter [Massilia oculi]